MQTSTRRARSGLPIAIEHGGPDAPVEAFFVHATGFCKELWRPIVDEISGGRDAPSWMSMDQRGHGASGRGEPPYRWHLLATDILDVIGSDRPVGIGHSSGGAAIAMAEVMRPGTFAELVLIEPVIPPPPFERRDIPLADVAERRRSSFPDRRGARERFARGPLASWDPVVLDLYIDHGFVEDRDGIHLACPPDVEADFYREGSNHDTWDHVPDIDVPVTIVAGERSRSHPEPYLSELAGRFRDPELVVVPGRGHLVPMEAPSAIADVVSEVLARR